MGGGFTAGATFLMGGDFTAGATLFSKGRSSIVCFVATGSGLMGIEIMNFYDRWNNIPHYDVTRVAEIGAHLAYCASEL